MSRVAVIGLGGMGAAIARRLLATGHSVSVWNRSPGAVEALAAAGASPLRAAEDAFASDTVLSVLANDAAVDAVFSADMLRRGGGALHLNMASISRAETRRQDERHREAGVRYVAAPVLGRPALAEAGRLNIVTGGAGEHVAAAAGVLEALGARSWHAGDSPASASLVKIAVNYNILCALQAMGESITLVERGGIDPGFFAELLTSASFSGTVHSTYGRLIAERDYFPAAFSAVLGRKDLDLAERAAAELGAALPASPVLRELFDAAVVDANRREGDWSIIAEVIRDRARAAGDERPAPAAAAAESRDTLGGGDAGR